VVIVSPWHLVPLPIPANLGVTIMPVEVRGGRDFKVLKVNNNRVPTPPLLKVLKVTNGMKTKLA
jgi:hypothetical protein